jgi:hypothetical protein
MVCTCQFAALRASTWSWKASPPVQSLPPHPPGPTNPQTTDLSPVTTTTWIVHQCHPQALELEATVLFFPSVSFRLSLSRACCPAIFFNLAFFDFFSLLEQRPVYPPIFLAPHVARCAFQSKQRYKKRLTHWILECASVNGRHIIIDARWVDRGAISTGFCRIVR